MDSLIIEAKDAKLEVRTQENKPTTLAGYALTWNSLSRPLVANGVTFRERFLPGAFAADMKSGRDIRALVDHDKMKILGRSSAGTLQLAEDDIGLRFIIAPPDTSYGRDIVESVRRGDVSGVSIGFNKPIAKFINENNERVREVRTATLGEISITGFPAYTETSVEARSLEPADFDALKLLLPVPLPPSFTPDANAALRMRHRWASIR